MSSNHSSDQAKTEATFTAAMNIFQRDRCALAEFVQEAERAKKSGRSAKTLLISKMKRWRDEDVELSLKIKEKGNDAFKAGDMRRAYLLYSACLQGLYSEPDAAYWLNRAAVCLKVKAYKHAESDATNAYEDGNAAQAVAVKALYRRAQARRFLGKLTDAEDDLQKALQFSPNESSLLAEVAELRKIQDKSPEELQQWLAEHEGKTFPIEGMNKEKVEKEAEELRSFIGFGGVE